MKQSSGVLELVVVAVQVVRGDVRDDGDVRLEVIDVVQLETADFEDIIVEVLGRDLIGVGFPDVSSEADVETCVPEKVIDEGRRGGLAVRAGYANLLRGVIPSREFDFRDDARPLVAEFHDKGGHRRDSGALHDLVRVKDKVLRVAAFLKGDVPFGEGLYVFFIYLPTVGEEYVHSLFLCEYGSAHAAFRTSEYNQS
mgnify:CR=1 FL=1